MSEYLAAAAQVLSVPEVLVQRSAEARAKASGTDLDSILQAWAGGEALPSAPAPAPAPSPEAASAPEAASTPDTDTEPEAGSPDGPAAPVEAVAPVATPVAVAVIDALVAEPVRAASLSDRIRISSRVGAVAGLVLSLLGWLFSAQFIVGRAGVVGEEGSLSASIGVDPAVTILTAILISVVIGVAVAGLARMVPAWTSPGMKLTGSALPSLALGIILGGLIGALGGSIVAGLGAPPELPDDPTSVPVLAAIIWSALTWLAGGWLIGTLVQALGVPVGVDPHEIDEARTVQARLVSAFGLPLVAGLGILIMVLSFAFVFISFPSYSPLTGTVLAGSILGFAALSTSKPNMKAGLSELLVAAAGMGVIVILIYAVLQTTGAGGHDDEEEAGHADTTVEGEVEDGGVEEGGVEDGDVGEGGADEGEDETLDVGEAEARISLIF